jgi:hypothetical protein
MTSLHSLLFYAFSVYSKLKYRQKNMNNHNNTKEIWYVNRKVILAPGHECSHSVYLLAAPGTTGSICAYRELVVTCRVRFVLRTRRLYHKRSHFGSGRRESGGPSGFWLLSFLVRRDKVEEGGGDVICVPIQPFDHFVGGNGCKLYLLRDSLFRGGLVVLVASSGRQSRFP